MMPQTFILGSRIWVVCVRQFPSIRAHIASAIRDTYPGSAFDPTMQTFPSDEQVDPEAYLRAIRSMPKGGAVTVFTPVRPIRRMHPSTRHCTSPHLRLVHVATESGTVTDPRDLWELHAG